MKNLKNSLIGSSLMLLMANPAFAVDTARTYNSGILVGLFLAFCALVVVVQLMPTLILLIGFVKGLIRGTDKETSRHGNKA
ncbi:MAG: hypothetical protein IBX47_00745 [Desulfuromonadales bacterium]|nr:hypothetical protein [Desulfuromonadales bacterium]